MIVEFIIENPRTGIIIISLLVSFFISLINFFVLDKEKVRESKKKQKELQAKMKVNKSNPEKMMEIQKEVMSNMMENMKHLLRPMIFTILPVLIVFYWMKDIFVLTEISKSWIWYYIGSAIIFGLIFRKLFKLP